MKQQSDRPRFEAATVLSQGARDYQEDAVVTDFPIGAESGLVVLSDGMGGHAAGDVASKIVMTEVFSELKFQSGSDGGYLSDIPDILRNATGSANECLKAHIETNPEAEGMGATLIATILQGSRLNWISVGDSPLFLFRDGELRQLNEDHSLAPQIDMMVTSGLIDEEDARDHPDRNALTSVLSGEDIPKIDCPEQSFVLQDGDMVVVSSDGIQFLEPHEIATVLENGADESCDAIARQLLDEICQLDDPDQDNISIVVLRASLPDEVPDNARVKTVPLERWKKQNTEPKPDSGPVKPRRVTVAPIPLRAEARR